MKFIIEEQALAYRYVEVEAENSDSAFEKWANGEARVINDFIEFDTDTAKAVASYMEEEWRRENV